MMKKLRPFLLPFCLGGLATSVFAHEGQHQKILAPDGEAGDLFGRSVAISGETMVIGAQHHDHHGAAYVFVLDEPTETWVFEAKLIPSNGQDDDDFAQSVAISGDLVIVGSPAADGLGDASGAAYIYTRSGTVWTEDAVLEASDGGTGDAFGTSVSTSGGTVLIGARQGYNGNIGAGAAYVFVQSGSSWTEEAKLTPPLGKSFDKFGNSVSLVGNTAIVGAPNATGSSATSGAVYAFTRSGTTWTLAQKISPPGGSNGDLFGYSVDLFQQAIVAGAPGDDDAALNAGAAYKFSKSGSSWALNQKIVPITGQANDGFGVGVARSFRSIVVGVPLDDEPEANQGSARFFGEAGGGQVWGEIYIADDGAIDDRLGGGIDVDDCWMAAGAFLNDALGVDSGAVYVYHVAEPTTYVRNGNGVNPVCMTTIDPPALGGTWTIQVDASAYPQTTGTLVAGYQNAQGPQLYPFGELLINLGSPRSFTSAIAGGGIAVHSVAIPASPWLIGYVVNIQAALYDGPAIITLCNAELARIGCP